MKSLSTLLYEYAFSKDGNRLKRPRIEMTIEEFCDENNFRFCDIHSLRHFYASALINEGVDAAAVSGALGHSVISTTTSIYCHVFQQAQARAGDAIASVLDFSSKNKQSAKDTAKDNNAK